MEKKKQEIEEEAVILSRDMIPSGLFFLNALLFGPFGCRAVQIG